MTGDDNYQELTFSDTVEQLGYTILTNPPCRCAPLLQRVQYHNALDGSPIISLKCHEEIQKPLMVTDTYSTLDLQARFSGWMSSFLQVLGAGV